MFWVIHWMHRKKPLRLNFIANVVITSIVNVDVGMDMIQSKSFDIR